MHVVSFLLCTGFIKQVGAKLHTVCTLTHWYCFALLLQPVRKLSGILFSFFKTLLLFCSCGSFSSLYLSCAVLFYVNLVCFMKRRPHGFTSIPTWFMIVLSAQYSCDVENQFSETLMWYSITATELVWKQVCVIFRVSPKLQREHHGLTLLGGVFVMAAWVMAAG